MAINFINCVAIFYNYYKVSKLILNAPLLFSKTSPQALVKVALKVFLNFLLSA